SAAAMAIQLRRCTRSPIQAQPRSAAMKGEVLWMTRVFATVVRATALMKQVEAMAKQSAIATPGQPMPRICGQAEPRSWMKMTTSRKAAVKMERQNTVVQGSVSTSRASSPPVLQHSAAAATRTTPRERSAAEAAVEDMPPILGVLPHLARPASLLHRARPGVGHQDLGALDLVQGAVARLVLDHDALALAADGQRELLRLEERFLGGLHVHGRAEDVPALDGHQRIPPGAGVRALSSISTKTNS